MEDGASGQSATDQGPIEAKPEDPFRILARNFLLTNIDPSKEEASSRDLTISLAKIARTVQEIFRGEMIYAQPSKQQGHLKSTAKICAQLLNRLASLNSRNALALMGELEGRPAPQFSVDDDSVEGSAPLSTNITFGVTGTRLADFEDFRAKLLRARDNGWILSQVKESNRRGAPKISESAIVGIADLARLWREYRGTEVTSSRNDGQFGTFAVQFFRLLQLFEGDAQVRTALRR